MEGGRRRGYRTRPERRARQGQGREVRPGARLHASGRLAVEVRCGSLTRVERRRRLNSAVGMVTGDADTQKEGNLKAEKAEWLKG